MDLLVIGRDLSSDIVFSSSNVDNESPVRLDLGRDAGVGPARTISIVSFYCKEVLHSPLYQFALDLFQYCRTPDPDLSVDPRRCRALDNITVWPFQDDFDVARWRTCMALGAVLGARPGGRTKHRMMGILRLDVIEV